MEISRQNDDARQTSKRSDTFTGEVWGEPLLTDVPDAATNNVRFAPGARTDWHRHEHGQILYVTEGQGRVRSRDGEELTVGPGDTIWAGPNEEHYHGADPDRFFGHVAISFGTTEWLDPVTDDDYGTSASG